MSRFILGERLHGAGGTAIRRGTLRGGHPSRSLLVTVTGPAELEELAPRLSLDTVPGVARQVHLGALGGGAVGVVEEEPCGRPLSGAALPLGADLVAVLVRQVAAVLAAAHRAGRALGGLQPELIYARPAASGPVVTGLAPRAAILARRAFAFPHVYAPADESWEPAADVFSLCALASHWLSGHHPYRGPRAGAQLLAIARGERRPWSGPPGWGDLMARGLSPRGAERPPLAEVVDAMGALAATARPARYPPACPGGS